MEAGPSKASGDPRALGLDGIGWGRLRADAGLKGGETLAQGGGQLDDPSLNGNLPVGSLLQSRFLGALGARFLS